MAVHGGHKLKRFLKEAQRKQSTIKKIEIGFIDEGSKRIASLAATHEFGLTTASVQIPERPAFRNGITEIRRGALLPEKIKLAKANNGYLTNADVIKLARMMHAIIVDSYLNFHGAPLSRLQTERKAGTKGAGKQLIGSEGPKLISHIGLWVDGKRRE